MKNNIESSINYGQKVFIEVEIGKDAWNGEAQLCHRIDYYDDSVKGVHYYYLELRKAEYDLIVQVLKEHGMV